MANGLGLIIEQNNKLIISPQIYQALEIMQLTLPELIDYINNELVENPLLEVEEEYEQDDLEQEKFAEEEEIMPPQKDDQWLDSIVGEVLREDKDNWTISGQYENEAVTYEGQWFDNNNLVDYLAEQLRFIENGAKLTPEQFSAAQYIIGNLDSNGYLSLSVENLSKY